MNIDVISVYNEQNLLSYCTTLLGYLNKCFFFLFK